MDINKVCEAHDKKLWASREKAYHSLCTDYAKLADVVGIIWRYKDDSFFHNILTGRNYTKEEMKERKAKAFDEIMDYVFNSK